MRVLRFGLSGTAIVLLCGFVAGHWSWRQLHRPATPPGGRAVVSVARGESFKTTAENLRAAGLIRYPRLLRAWARWTGEDRRIRSGDYRFEGAVSPLQVLQALLSPTAALNRITIPEGKTLREVASLLEAAGFGGADHFLCAAEDPRFLLSLDVPASGLEGYLFPDTYAFEWRTAPHDILKTMVERFREQVAPLESARRKSGMSEAEMVTLASIIEKETGTEGERPLVSAVFHNRMRIGMRLQADPTAVYGREVNGPVTAADLESDTAYNTYLHPGLPPGPICNPGLASLRAAVKPAEVPYLYFVAGVDGTHVFSRTLREHNRAVAALRRRTVP